MVLECVYVATCFRRPRILQRGRWSVSITLTSHGSRSSLWNHRLELVAMVFPLVEGRERLRSA